MEDQDVATLNPVSTPAEPPPDPAEAQAADAELDRLIGIVREPLARLAVLIHRIRERRLYQALTFESFEAYIGSKQLQFSRSFVFQLAKVGKMLDTVGVDPVILPEHNLEITKLAQIARLPDPGEQRQIIESGSFAGSDQEPRQLSDIPVRELSTLVDQRLGKEPRSGRGIRTLSQTYDEEMPWEGPDRFADDQSAAIAHQFSREMRIPGSADNAGWRQLIDGLGQAIRPLSGPERDDAINALSKLYQELVGY